LQSFIIRLQKDTSNSEKEAVEHIYRQLRNAEPPDFETARSVFEKLFFSDSRYDLGEVGRFRINTKLGLKTDMGQKVSYERRHHSNREISD
jgi:DNA-directed RNA polymerase subunit beta